MGALGSGATFWGLGAVATYIRPVGDSAKPVNLFIPSVQATYTLVLRRADTPADTIVIRDRTARQAAPLAVNNPGPLGPSANHVEGRGLLGEKYLLQNISSAVMVLADQEFDREDSPEGGQVVGAALQRGACAARAAHPAAWYAVYLGRKPRSCTVCR